MTEATKSGREVGRPRSFSDEDAFRATTRLLVEHGASGITLADLARDLGCTAPALNVRFGSRIGLLRAYYAWATQMDAERFHLVREQHASPLAALRARFTMPVRDRLEEVVDSSSQAKLISLIAEAQADPEFADLVIQRAAAFESGTAELITAAVDSGELKPVDARSLAHLIFSAISGASFLWSAQPRGSITDESSAILETILAPYLITD